ncbi:MAG: uroporphyrinogen decarboxylase family protein, partial [Atribacterota bacterium]
MSVSRQWTPRERVFAALAHKEPDRVPINFGGCAQTTILECPPDGKNCTRLYEYLGITDYPEPVTGALANQVYNLDERVMQRFGSDFRLLLPQGGKILSDRDGSKTILGISCGLRVKKIGYYDDIFEFPLQNCTRIEDIRNYPYWPSDDEIKKIAEGKREEAKRMKETTGCIILEDVYLAYPALLYSLLTGYEKWLMDMKLDPHFYFALSDKLFEIGRKVVEYFIGAIGEEVDIVSTYDDLGTQEAPILSHRDYERFIRPYEEKMINHIKKYTDARI